MNFHERIAAERKALKEEMAGKTDAELKFLEEDRDLRSKNPDRWHAARGELIRRTLRREKLEKELEAIKKFQRRTDEELREWLLDLEMSNSYSRYEDTIKAIRAEVAKREKLAEVKKLSKKATAVENLAIVVRRMNRVEIEALLKTATKAMLNEMFFAMTGTKLCAKDWILRTTLKKRLIEIFADALMMKKAA